MPRNKETNEKIKGERREKILSASLKLFATKGLAATRITDIATATGMSQGLIYHYFKSKEEVFNKLIIYAIDKLNEATINLEKMSIPAKEKITIATEGLLKGLTISDDTAGYYFLITQTALSEAFPPEAKEIIKSKNDIKYRAMERIFKQGLIEGTVKPYNVKEMTTLFFSSINGLALNRAVNGIKYQSPDKKIILNMFLND